MEPRKLALKSVGRSCPGDVARAARRRVFGAVLRGLLAVVLAAGWATPVRAGEEPGPFLATLEPHKRIYLTHSLVLDGRLEEVGYQDREVVIQFSFRKRIVSRLYFAYSQRSFWQLYNEEGSRPIRTSDYNPELFLAFDDLWVLDRWRFGLWEHESNGGQSVYDAEGNPINLSRTWNRSYAYGEKRFGGGAFALAAKVWAVLDRKDQEYGSFGEDNPDIRDYLGSGELYGRAGGNSAGLELMFRRGTRAGTETWRLEGWYGYDRLFGGAGHRFNLYFQLFTGYGDSLIDYNRKIERISIGVSFT